ncbi:DapH/DapD/GlmU-related protein [Benzoatithermus flavus]|uniref:Acyltransferase n=1 Tax=Benzoatithermus flavus TaxID=3108223 RepID=A0ABU8XV57_9PROT
MQQLDEQDYIRSKLFSGDRSAVRRYADLVVGPGASYWQLARYELITMLFGRVSGALGLVLRKLFYPRLFRRCGKGVVFGRDLVIRNAHLISLGDNVVLDDGCVLDGRGAGPQGVTIGDRVILGRGVSIQAKIGPITIGADSDIGMHTVIHSQGGVEIGRAVVMGGGCKLSGGVFQTVRSAGTTAGSEMLQREQTRWTKGPIRIGDKCLIGMGATFLDGVEVGEGAVIGAGSVVIRSVPAYAVAAGVPGRVLRQREEAPALAPAAGAAR